MLETIEKLLILQDRDRKIHRVQQELAHIGPNAKPSAPRPPPPRRNSKPPKTASNKSSPTANGSNSTSRRKNSRSRNTPTSSLQTRKNEEYRALAHEIETCKADITKIEDQEIVLMEQAEAGAKGSRPPFARSRRGKKTGRRPDRATQPARGKFEKGTRRIAAAAARNWRRRWTNPRVRATNGCSRARAKTSSWACITAFAAAAT